jgi:2-polyprenyl-6-methoxyphenol hydroxylase-like FAD-dependent oxidoreductase
MSSRPDTPPLSVLVVGAGPVGLTLACDLAQRGTSVRIVDKLAAPTTESRAVVVHARNLEALDRLGVAQELIDSGVMTTRLVFHADGREIGDVELDTVDSPFPFSVTTAQTETERILTERLAAAGIVVEREVELLGFDQDDGGVDAHVRHGDGTEETIRCAFIAGTDGSRSRVREVVGTQLEGSFKGERFLLGDVEADDALDRAAMHMFFSPAGHPLMAFPMAGTRMRLIAQLDDADRNATATLERLQQVADERAPGIRLRSSHWLTIFEVHHAQVPTYRFGRAFLAGDAAHVHSPAGGQGMNTGMQDAYNLGWKLALAAQGLGGDALLDSYGTERHPVAAAVIKVTTQITNAGTIDHVLERRLRNRLVHFATGLTPFNHLVARKTEETTICYTASPIVVGKRRRHGPAPGEIAPDVAGSGLQEALVAAARTAAAAHTIVSIAPAGASPAVTASRPADTALVLVADTAVPRPPAGATVLVDARRSIADRYGVGHNGGVFVVRPDGYVGAIADAGDDAAVAAYFAALR